ncbi:Uncharacterized protein Adt_06474 [Abeliophyllum distichum]|uniref:Uncharacterized protein n=1 Tax=Abeliophyllum distichum TaxID=126358 RepID=A0ABD1V8E0_9LAMI
MRTRFVQCGEVKLERKIDERIDQFIDRLEKLPHKKNQVHGLATSWSFIDRLEKLPHKKNQLPDIMLISFFIPISWSWTVVRIKYAFMPTDLNKFISCLEGKLDAPQDTVDYRSMGILTSILFFPLPCVPHLPVLLLRDMSICLTDERLHLFQMDPVELFVGKS